MEVFEELNRTGRKICSVKGNSMRPMLRPGRDMAVLTPVRKPLKKYDCALFRNSEGKLVLHRIIDVKDGFCSFRGDNNVSAETGIPEDQVSAVMIAVIRDGKEIPVNSFFLRLYGFLRCHTWRFRKAVRNIFTPPKQANENPVNRNDEKHVFGFLYSLLAGWLNQSSVSNPGFSEKEWECLWTVSESHSISSAVCYALEKSGLTDNLPEEISIRFEKARDFSIRKTLLMEKDFKLLSEFMERNGIWYVPLKGIKVKEFYPGIGARQMADFDILFDPSYSEEIAEFLNRNGFQTIQTGKGAHDEYRKKLYSFELHRELFSPSPQAGVFSVKASEYYSGFKNQLVRDSESSCGLRLTGEDFYIYTLAHAYKHYSGAGTGIRTLIDIFLLRKNKKKMDQTNLEQQLELLGILEFEQVIGNLSEKLFNPDNSVPLTESEKQMLNRIENAGVYGTLKNKVQSELEEFGLDSAGNIRVKVRYLMRKLFPDISWYKENEPFAFSHRWAVPFVWIRRLARGFIFQRNHNFKIAKEVITGKQPE